MPSLINELIFDEVKSIVDEGDSLLLIDQPASRPMKASPCVVN